MHTPHTAPIEHERHVGLYVSLGHAHPSWWSRWLRQSEPPERAALLSITPQALALKPSHSQTTIEVLWSSPFIAHITCWPYGSGTTEINISLRARQSAPQAPWLQMRTLWPGHAVVPDTFEHKQEQFPFLRPEHFQSLWLALNYYADLHGTILPQGVVLDQPQDVLTNLRSEGELPQCISCGSSSIAHIAPQVYRCNACQYEGGEGWAALQEDARRRAIDTMQPEARANSARADLISARRLLLSCKGTVRGMKPYLTDTDDIDLGATKGTFEKAIHRIMTAEHNDTSEREHYQSATNVQRMAAEALRSLKDAAYKDPNLPLQETLTQFGFIDASSLGVVNNAEAVLKTLSSAVVHLDAIILDVESKP